MSRITQLFKEYSYRPRKSAGQNFLTDPGILKQIDEVIQCPEGDLLLEVGGGYGTLTAKLAAKGRPLTVVEVDHKLFAMLEQRFKDVPQLSLVKADILKLDLVPLAPLPPAKITVAGNIPYYLTTSLMTRFLAQYHGVIRKIYLMVQKEVASRLVAEPGTKAYGALTICAQYYSIPKMLLDVPARCFKPRPKVDSAFIELEVKNDLPLDEAGEKRLFALTRAIFQSRRKILSNSLKSLGKTQEQSSKAMEKLGLDPQMRGERLDLGKLIELSKALEGAEL